jgi:hypothetical protein
MIPAVSEKAAWRIIGILSIVAAGAAIGDESPAHDGADYFWDLASYVMALDAANPYQSDALFPFLYPPVAADLFSLARSHLFELMSIAYAGAIVFFLRSFAQLGMPRGFEWLLAITAMGGLGVVSLKTGNVAIVMNLTLLALILDAAAGRDRSRQLLPIVIAAGALIKPQFALYLGLLLVLEHSRGVAVVKILAAGSAIAAVHASYLLFRPAVWNDYVAGVMHRTISEKDFGWGSAALFMHLTDSTAAALAGFVVTLLAVCALAYAAWQQPVRSGLRVPLVPVTCLAFVVLTFANPRVPLYDLYAAGIALVICCSFAARRECAWAMAIALAINLVPWLIAEFARTPTAYPSWTMDLLITHMAGLALLLLSLARTGLVSSEAPAAA